MQVEVMQVAALPFIGTSLGACCVLFMKNRLDLAVQRILTGFA